MLQWVGGGENTAVKTHVMGKNISWALGLAASEWSCLEARLRKRAARGGSKP